MQTVVLTWKRRFIWALILSLFVSSFTFSQITEAQTSKDLKKQVYVALQKAVKYYQKSNNDYNYKNFDWELIGLSHAGEKLESSKWQDQNEHTAFDYWASAMKNEKEPGQIAKIAIALMKNGYDPTNFNGKNLLNEIVKQQKANGEMGDGQYTIFNHVLSIVALEMYDYDYDRDKATEFLLEHYDSDTFYPDDWAFTLHALAFLEDIDGVEDTEQAILKKLQEQIASNGSISDSPDTTLEALAALPAVGEDVLDNNWSKIVTYALENQLADGSFQSAFSNGDSSPYTTEKGLYALAVAKTGTALYTRLTDKEKAGLKVFLGDEQQLPEDVKVYDGLTNLLKDKEVTPTKNSYTISSKQLFVRADVKDLAEAEKPLAILVKAMKGKTVVATAIVESNSADAQFLTAGLTLSKGTYRVEINFWYGLAEKPDIAKDSVSLPVTVK